MPKRRRLLTPMRKKSKQNTEIETKEENVPETPEKEVSTARGRLKGALLEALEPGPGEESDASVEPTPTKRDRERRQSNYNRWDDETEEERPRRRRSPIRQSYVLKLFDRSVDLSQFEEDCPLYPICRAWIVNQPKADYRKLRSSYREPEPLDDSVDLPRPKGPPVSRIPELTPEQKARSVDNIKLEYDDSLPSKEELLRIHTSRWAGVRAAWLATAARVEARYDATQRVLNKINVSTL